MKTLTINPDKTFTVREENGMDGNGNPMVTQWDIAPDHAERHRAQFAPQMVKADRDKLDGAIAEAKAVK